MNNHNIKDALENWTARVGKFQKPNTRKAIYQILTAFLPFFGLLVLMYFSLSWSYFITVPIGLLTALFLVRIFIIQHDCGHQSFLKSRKWNNVIGFISSVFSTIPYNYWSRMHNVHHTHNGKYEYRGLGDINFLTTEEYGNRSALGKFLYQLRRNPIVQFIIVPVIYLSIVLRAPIVHLRNWKSIRWSHLLNNLLIVAIYGTLAMLLGWQKMLLVHLPVLWVFGMISFWFFYIQHQHEHNYNETKDKWDFLLASVQGSTYYKLPRVAQWFSGNIGFHHIHHLNSRIPNYNLEACSRANPELNSHTTVLTFRQSLKCMHHKLWDEEKQRMITFEEYRRED